MDKENEASASNQVCKTCLISLVPKHTEAAAGIHQAENEVTAPDDLKLKVTSGPSADTEFSKPGILKLTVGRTRASKIWIKDSAVSEKHAEISWDGKQWCLQDQGSSNGTLLNGVSLQAQGKIAWPHVAPLAN